MAAPMFEKIALVGIGLIGSSLARVIRREGLAGHIAISTRSAATLARAEELGLGDSYTTDAKEAVRDADLVIVSVPVGASGEVAEEIAPALKPGAILTDVGSTKASVIAQMQPHVPAGVHFIPGHPLAGTEKSGPGCRLRRPVREPLVHLHAAARTPIRRRWRGCRNSGAAAAPTSTRWTRSITT